LSDSCTGAIPFFVGRRQEFLIVPRIFRRATALTLRSAFPCLGGTLSFRGCFSVFFYSRHLLHHFPRLPRPPFFFAVYPPLTASFVRFSCDLLQFPSPPPPVPRTYGSTTSSGFRLRLYCRTSRPIFPGCASLFYQCYLREVPFLPEVKAGPCFAKKSPRPLHSQPHCRA